MGSEEKFMLLYGATISFLLVAGIYAGLNENAEWKTFSKEHACKKVGDIKGGARLGFGHGITANGQIGTGMVTTFEADKTGWLCGDGITYWR